MNIVFFHGNGIVPTLGGISRITDTLGALFVDKGNNVWYIGAQDKHKGQKYCSWQSFLPSSELFADENIRYIINFIKKHQSDLTVKTAVALIFLLKKVIRTSTVTKWSQTPDLR